MDYVFVIIRFLLGFTLAFAGVEKLRDPTTFRTGVLHYRILPNGAAHWYARLLPFTEIGLAILLVLGIWIRFASWVLIMMFLSFAIAVAVNLRRKREIPCFCFGSDASEQIGWHTLLRILLLLICAIILALVPEEIRTLPVWVGRWSSADLVALIPSVFLALFGIFILALLERSPWIVKAWTTPAIRRPKLTHWYRLDEETAEAEEPS